MPSISTAYLQRGLTLRHLHLLVELDETRHVGRVAAALNVSQPAISKALAEIEAGIGVTLFERTPRGLVPTVHGARIVRFAHTVFNDIDRLGAELNHVGEGARPDAIAIGAMPSVGSSVVPAAIVRSQQRLPGFAATVSEGPMFVLLRQLQTGKLDLVVGGVLDQVPPDLVQQPLYVDPVVVVCAASHPLASAQRPTWAALVEHPWVLPPREAGARKAIETLLRRYSGSGPTVLAETVSPDMTIELLAQAPALGVLPQRLAQRYADAGRAAVVDIQLPGLTLAMAVFSLAGTKPLAAIEAFVQSLIDTAGQR